VDVCFVLGHAGQTAGDNIELQNLFENPTFNPAHCEFVQPKRNDLNSLKVDKDIALSLDYLGRGVHGFNDLPSYLKDDILLKCDTFNPVLQKALVYSIRLCHLKYTVSLGWETKLFNLQLPRIETYLQDSYFVTETEDQTSKLKQRTDQFINNFSKEMITMHEKYSTEHAFAEFEVMKATYGSIRSMPLCPAYCELMELTDLDSKKKALTALQQALNLACKFAFPAACQTCSDLLDNILRKQDFAPGEPHQVLLALPMFDEEMLFIRPSPLPAEPKPAGKATSTVTAQTPKKVSNMHVTIPNK
jgi:hypothetical protein